MEGVRPGHGTASGGPRGVGPLVHPCHGGDRHGTTADDPRLLRVPRRAVRLRLPRTRRARRRRGGRRDRQAPLGGPRPRQLGDRPRHLVRPRPHVPRGRRPSGAAVDQCAAAARLSPRARRPPGAAAPAGGADRRQRQRRAQPRPLGLLPWRGGLRLGATLRRRRTGGDDGRAGRCARCRARGSLPPVGADAGPFHPRALPGRPGRRRRGAGRGPRRGVRPRVAVDDVVHARRRRPRGDERPRARARPT